MKLKEPVVEDSFLQFSDSEESILYGNDELDYEPIRKSTVAARMTKMIKGSVFSRRSTKKKQVDPKKELKKCDVKIKLKHRHFDWLRETSALLFNSTLILLFLEILQRELDASYSPGLTRFNKLV